MFRGDPIIIALRGWGFGAERDCVDGTFAGGMYRWGIQRLVSRKGGTRCGDLGWLHEAAVSGAGWLMHGRSGPHYGAALASQRACKDGCLGCLVSRVEAG